MGTRPNTPFRPLPALKRCLNRNSPGGEDCLRQAMTLCHLPGTAGVDCILHISPGPKISQGPRSPMARIEV